MEELLKGEKIGYRMRRKAASSLGPVLKNPTFATEP